MNQDSARKGIGKASKGSRALQKTADDLDKTSQLARQGVETLKKISRTLSRLAGDCEASRATLMEARAWLESHRPGDGEGEKTGTAEGLAELRQRFLLRLGHDLKTPLTSIRGSQSLLKSGVVGKLSQEALEMVDITERNTNRLITLVDQIMELEKSGMEQQRLRKSTCSLEGILQRAMREMVMNLTAGQSEVSVFSSLSPIYGNEEALVQIVGDLLIYALGLPPRPGRVVVWTERLDGGVKVCIRAQGKRLQPEVLDKVFEPLEGDGDSASHHFSGAGLEMAVCRAIVAEHAGQIGVDNHPEGCVFWFTLPGLESRIESGA